MIEVKISLELTKNGVQKSIHAKTGEDESRKAIITLTENGKVFNAEGYNVAVAFDDGTFISSADERNLVVVKNGCIEFTLPGNLIVASGERLCEIQVSNDKRILYSPVFRVLVEKSLGQDGMKEPVGNTIRHQNVIPDLQSKDTISEDDEIAVCTPEDELTTKRKISSLPFLKTPPETAALALTAMLAASDNIMICASIEKPEDASKPDSLFAQALSFLAYMADSEVYYAPASNGDLDYTNPRTFSNEELVVEKGRVYHFFNNANFEFQIEVVNTAEQVGYLFSLIFDRYTNPTSLSAFKNDSGFVNSKKVEELFCNFVAARNLVDEYGVTLAFEKLVTDNQLTNKNDVTQIVDKALTEFEIPTEARHTHENKSVLDNLGENEDGDLTYKGEPVSSGTADGSSAKPTPEVIAAQVVTIMLHNSILEMGGLVYGGVTSVDDANTAGKFFQSAIQQVAQPPAWGGSVLVFSPTDEGNVIYIDPMSSDEKTIPVQPGVVYIFYGTEDPYETTYTTAIGIGIRELLINGVVL